MPLFTFYLTDDMESHNSTVSQLKPLSYLRRIQCWCQHVVEMKTNRVRSGVVVVAFCAELSSLCQTGFSFCLTVPDEMKREVPKLFVQISITPWCPQTKPLTCEWVS